MRVLARPERLLITLFFQSSRTFPIPYLMKTLPILLTSHFFIFLFFWLTVQSHQMQCVILLNYITDLNLSTLVLCKRPPLSKWTKHTKHAQRKITLSKSLLVLLYDLYDTLSFVTLSIFSYFTKLSLFSRKFWTSFLFGGWWVGDVPTMPNFPVVSAL